MDAGVFELKIQLFCGKTMPISMWYESLIESLQSNFHTPPETLIESLQSNFHTPLKVYIENFSESFRAP